jgi:ribosomal protein L9
MIADAIAANGIKLDHQRVIIPEAIRTLGDFVVTLKLHQKVRMDLNVKVSRAV